MRRHLTFLVLAPLSISSAVSGGIDLPLTIQDLKGAYKSVTLDAQNESIESVVRSVIDPAIAVTFHDLDVDRRVSVKFEGTPRDQALAILADRLDLYYSVSSRKELSVTQWSHLSRHPSIVASTPGLDVPSLISRPTLQYPEVARVARFEAHVLMRITINLDGSVNVGDMLRCDLNHASHGPSDDMHEKVCPLFQAAAAESLAQWKFEPPAEEGQYHVPVAFKLR